MPTWLVAAELVAGTLRTVLDDQAGAETPIHVVRPRSGYTRPPVLVIVAALRQAANTAGSPFRG